MNQLNASIQYYEAIGAWGMAQSLRLILASMLVAGLTACGGSGGGSSPVSGSPGVGSPVTSSESVTLKSGVGYECFLRSGVLRCRGSNFRLPEISASFTEVASGVVSFETFADSLCFESSVLTRPVSGSSGPATYCAGEGSFDTATFGWLFDYNGAGVIRYGGDFNQVTHGSVNLLTSLILLSGADVTLSQFLAYSAGAGNSLHIVTDGAGSSVTATCVLSSGTLTCPTFSIGGI